MPASGGQKPQFWGIFDIGAELLYRPPVTDEGQILCARAHTWYTFTCQISRQSVYSVALWQQKTPFAVFWISAFSGVTS